MSNKKRLNRRKCVVALVAIVLFIILMLSLNAKPDYSKLTILLDNEYIELIKRPLIDEGENIFFSLEDVKKLFDDTIYYNEAGAQIITTGKTHVASLEIDDFVATINNEDIGLKVTPKIEDETVYIPITDLAYVYDIELYYAKRSNRIIIDSLDKEKTTAAVRQRTKLKEGKGLFSKNIETLIIGENLVVLEDLGKYQKVRSSLGNIGYTKTNKLSVPSKVRDNATYEKIELTPYFNYSNSAGIYDDIEVDKSKRNVVLPNFYILEKDNKLLDKTNITTATYAVYKKWADSNGLDILPTLTNQVPLSDSLRSFQKRNNVIWTLREKLLEYGYWGININFKTIDDFGCFYRFLLEITPAFRDANLKVVVTINNNSLDREKIEKIVDCVIEE